MKKTLLATTAFALIAAHASAVDVELYGQVNKSMLGYTDGDDTNFVVTDNTLSSTRFGFKGAQALDNGLTASALFEGEMASDPSNNFTQAGTGVNHNQSNTPDTTSPNFTERQARVGLSGNFGGVYLGQQSTAIDGVLTQDLAGAQDVLSADINKIGGGLQFREAAGAHALSGVTVSSRAASIATNRDDSVRYDSPIFYGFQGRVSAAQGGDNEVSAFYDGAYGDFKMKGAAGVQLLNNKTTSGTGLAGSTTNSVDKRYAASASVAHSSGVAATLAYTADTLEHKTANAEEPEQWYGKLGYTFGNYEVAADYSVSDHYGSYTTSKDKLKTLGLGAQYNMGNGVSVAGLYRNLDSDITATNYKSIDLYGVNMRVKF